MRLDLDAEHVDPSRSYPMAGVLSFGRGLFIRQPIENGNTSYKVFYRLKPNHVVMSQLFGWEGALALSSEDFGGKFVSPQFPTFLCNESLLDRRFLGWIMRRPSFWKELGTRATGMGDRRRTLNPEALLSMSIPLPPLEEQGRIVARIAEIAGKIEEAKRLREEASAERSALLEVSMKAERRRLLEGAYPVERIGDVAEVTSGGTPSRDVAVYWNGTIPWVKTGELLDRDIIDSQEHITELGLKDSSAKLFPPETVLVALYGQGQTRGRTARLMIAASTNQACCAILPNPERLFSRYTQFWIMSLYTELRDKAFGGAQPNWSGSMIKTLEIAIPPLRVQERTVEKLDEFRASNDLLKQAQWETSRELEALLPAILDKAFKGEL